MSDEHENLSAEIALLREIALAFGIGQKSFEQVSRSSC